MDTQEFDKKWANIANRPPLYLSDENGEYDPIIREVWYNVTKHLMMYVCCEYLPEDLLTNAANYLDRSMLYMSNSVAFELIVLMFNDISNEVINEMVEDLLMIEHYEGAHNLTTLKKIYDTPNEDIR